MERIQVASAALRDQARVDENVGEQEKPPPLRYLSAHLVLCQLEMEEEMMKEKEVMKLNER
jgi:hypothetical protein